MARPDRQRRRASPRFRFHLNSARCALRAQDPGLGARVCGCSPVYGNAPVAGHIVNDPQVVPSGPAMPTMTQVRRNAIRGGPPWGSAISRREAPLVNSNPGAQGRRASGGSAALAMPATIAGSDSSAASARRAPPHRGIDVRERILDRHHLRPPGLPVLLGPHEAGQQPGLASRHQVRAVQPRRHMDHQVQPRPSRIGARDVGDRPREVAAKAEEGAHRAVDQACSAGAAPPEPPAWVDRWPAAASCPRAIPSRQRRRGNGACRPAGCFPRQPRGTAGVVETVGCIRFDSMGSVAGRRAGLNALNRPLAPQGGFAGYGRRGRKTEPDRGFFGHIRSGRAMADKEPEAHLTANAQKDPTPGQRRRSDDRRAGILSQDAERTGRMIRMPTMKPSASG